MVNDGVDPFEVAQQVAAVIGAEIVPKQTRYEGTGAVLFTSPMLIWRSAGGVQVVGTLAYDGVDLVGVDFFVDCLPRRTDARIVLRAETRATRLGKKLHLLRDATTGDAAFDDEVYIATAHEPTARAVLKSDAVRRHVRDLIPYVGFLAIDRGLEMRLGTAMFTNAPRARELLECFAALATALAPDGRSPYRLAPAVAPVIVPAPMPNLPAAPTRKISKGPRPLALGLAFALGAPMFLVAHLLPSPPTLFGPQVSGLIAGLALWFAGMVVSVVLILRGGTKSSGEMLFAAVDVYFVAVALVIPSLALGHEATLVANARFDTGGATIREGEVRRVVLNKGGSYLKLTAEWRDAETSVVLPEDCVRGKAPGRARVVTRPGALGLEWIESVDIE